MILDRSNGVLWAIDQFLGQDDEQFVVWRRMLLGDIDMDLLTKMDGWRKTHPELDANYWYTLGMLQASLLMADDAKRSLASALDRDDFTALDARPWVLVGKIYDEYGEVDAARTAYQKARSSPHADEMANWATSLIPSEKRGTTVTTGNAVH